MIKNEKYLAEYMAIKKRVDIDAGVQNRNQFSFKIVLAQSEVKRQGTSIQQ